MNVTTVNVNSLSPLKCGGKNLLKASIKSIVILVGNTKLVDFTKEREKMHSFDGSLILVKKQKVGREKSL